MFQNTDPFSSQVAGQGLKGPPVAFSMYLKSLSNIVLLCVLQDVTFLEALRNTVLEPNSPKFLERNTRWLFDPIKPLVC